MNRWLLGTCMALLCCMAGAEDLSAVRNQTEASMLLTGTIVVAPDGSVSSYSIDHPEKVVDVVKPLLEKSITRWKFLPVMEGNKPVAAQAEMSLRIIATRLDDGNYAMAIRGVHFGQSAPGEVPSFEQKPKPRYPMNALQSRVSGTVYLLARVDRHGQVEDAATEQVNLHVVAREKQMEHWRQVLADASLNAVKNATFHIPTSGALANADSWVVRIPISFNLVERGVSVPDTYGHWQSYIPGPKQKLPGFDKQDTASNNSDAIPDNGLFLADQSLQLVTPLSGT
ncbi:MAG: energy transducer TonB [Rhodanobacter sp.]